MDAAWCASYVHLFSSSLVTRLYNVLVYYLNKNVTLYKIYVTIFYSKVHSPIVQETINLEQG